MMCACQDDKIIQITSLRPEMTEMDAESFLQLR